MADNNNNNHLTQDPQMPSSSIPSPRIPLQLCGFLAGDTVQVQGDTGELQFSVQFNVHQKEPHSGEPFNFPGAPNVPEVGDFRDSVQSSPSSPYMTPNGSGEIQDHDPGASGEGEVSCSRSRVVTRLRSGVLSPVKYYHDGGCRVSRGSLSSVRRRRNKGGGEGDNVFEKMLERRSFPLRPCNSYAFFLMANWGAVKRSSFGETSKRLSKKWFKLPHDIKKEFESLALRDTARYKRQCILLKSDVVQETTTGLLADSE